MEVPEYPAQYKKSEGKGRVASDRGPENRNGLAKKRLIPAERRSPRSVGRERRNTDWLAFSTETMQNAFINGSGIGSKDLG